MAGNGPQEGAQNAVQIIHNNEVAMPEPVMLQMARQRASESIACINLMVHEYEAVK